MTIRRIAAAKSTPAVVLVALGILDLVAVAAALKALAGVLA